jgi:site-specific DNA recombinase
MRAIGYFRVISDIQQDAPSSLVELEEGFLQFCQERGYQPITVFVDMDSVGKINCAQYQHMLSYIRKQRESFHVVVKSLQHLHPDPQEVMRCLLELDSLGARVLSTDEELTDPLAAALQVWSTQRQGEKRGEQVREAMKIRAIHGKGLGRPPFGYRVGVDQKLEIVPEEAATVALIYRLYLEENMGVRLIARYLNEQGITTRRGGRWSIVGIRDILRNRVYLGTYSRFGIIVPGSHSSIISPQIFSKAQERLSAQPKQGGYTPRSPFLLSGLVYCGYCGNKMIGVNRSQTWTRHRDKGESKGEYRYYQCQSRTNQSVCQYHTRRADDLERMVIAILEKFSSPQARERIAKQPDLTMDYEILDRPQLEKRLNSLSRKLRGYLDQAAQGVISLERLRAVGEELVRERQFLEQRLALYDAEAKQEITAEQRWEYILEALQDLREQWEAMTFPSRRALLQHVLDRIVIYDDHVETQLRL